MATTTLTDSQRVPVLSEQKKQTEYMQSMAESLVKMAKSAWKDNGSLDNYIVTLLDGTKEKYKAVQKAWFLENGAETADGATLTALVDRWYTITRKPWNGWTRFYHTDVSSVSTGEKMGDLKGMTLVPSTDTVAGQDDFAGNPLFAITKVNWTMANSQPVITAIEGISPDFEIDNPDKLVGVVQMTGYHWFTTLSESSQYYDEGYSATWLQTKSHIEPLPEAVRPDKTVRPWVIHAAYIAGVHNGKMTCCSGQVPKGNVSHNGSHDMAKANGTDYSGTCSCDRSFLILMCRIMLGSLTIDGILNGCYSYYLSHTAKVSETGVNRIIVDASAKSAYVVGSNVIIITQKFASDDDKRQTCQGNTANRYKILDIEDVTIGTTTYAAIYVDAKTPFNTVAESTDSAVVPTIIFTVPWTSGSTDDVLGNTGSLNDTDGKHPIKLQGIEFANGQWEVLSDAINKLWKDTDGTYYYTCYTVNTATKQSTSITDDYIAGSSIQQPTGSDKWSYIKYNEYKNGMYFPTQVDGSSSTYTCDQVALNHDVDGQTHEFLCFGTLGGDVAPSGLSFLGLDWGLGSGWWSSASRLSPNGNRGAWGA
nr:MAG TPA: hypothetical protein [Caudoviricetes sp.]